MKKESKYLVEANYKEGIVKESLCETCMVINKTIEQEKWRYKLE